MPTITIDDEVFKYLQEKAAPFVDTPNVVLRRELGLDAATPAAPPRDNYGHLRLRRDATGLGDEERYLRGRMATITAGATVYKRSGVRSPRGADLNQIQVWLAGLVGSNNPENARLIQNLRDGSKREAINDVVVTVDDQAG